MSDNRQPAHPSGRAGGLDGLPSGHRAAATWRDDRRVCWYYRSAHHQNCRGGRVLVHLMQDSQGVTIDYRTIPTCIAHAISRHGVHPSGQPTAQYTKAMGESP